MSNPEMEAILRVQSDLFALMYRYTTAAVHGVFYEMYSKLSRMHDNDEDVCSHLQWSILRTHLWSAKIVSTVAAPWSRIAKECITLAKKLAKCNAKITNLSGFSDADEEHIDVRVTFPEILHAVLTSASRVVSNNLPCIMTTDTSQIANLLRQHHVVEDAVANICKDHLVEATPEAAKLRSISQRLEQKERELEAKEQARLAELKQEREMRERERAREREQEREQRQRFEEQAREREREQRRLFDEQAREREQKLKAEIEAEFQLKFREEMQKIRMASFNSGAARRDDSGSPPRSWERRHDYVNTGPRRPRSNAVSDEWMANTSHEYPMKKESVQEVLFDQEPEQRPVTPPHDSLVQERTACAGAEPTAKPVEQCEPEAGKSSAVGIDEDVQSVTAPPPTAPSIADPQPALPVQPAPHAALGSWRTTSDAAEQQDATARQSEPAVVPDVAYGQKPAAILTEPAAMAAEAGDLSSPSAPVPPPNSPPSSVPGMVADMSMNMHQYIESRVRDGIAQQPRDTSDSPICSKYVEVPSDNEYARLRSRYLQSDSDSDSELETGYL